ncbi:MAG: GNAT family N-acetyltransferase [Mobilitalea sp.]
MFCSERLTYRMLTEKDFDLFYELYSNKDVMRYAYRDNLKSLEEAKNAFKEILSMQLDNNGTQYIASMQNNRIDIGIVDYEVIIKNDNSGIFEIGYFIKPNYWGYGYGTEMGKAIIEFLFNNYNIHKIVASCNANNRSSEDIMKKIGMEYEGILKKTRYKNGRWDDEIEYGLLRDEWEKKLHHS